MPEIYVLDVGMCDKMLVLVCWNLWNFYASVQQNNIYIYLRKSTEKYTTFKEKCWKIFYRKL